MVRWILLALCLSLAVPAGGALALPCATPQAEPMPCCEQGMADCAQSGMAAACCSLVPGGSADRLLLSSQGVLGDASSRIHWSMPPVILGFSLPEVDTRGPQTSAAGPRSGPAHVPPLLTRTTVLLI